MTPYMTRAHRVPDTQYHITLSCSWLGPVASACNSFVHWMKRLADVADNHDRCPEKHGVLFIVNVHRNTWVPALLLPIANGKTIPGKTSGDALNEGVENRHYFCSKAQWQQKMQVYAKQHSNATNVHFQRLPASTVTILHYVQQKLARQCIKRK